MPLELTQSDIAVLNKEHGVIFGRGAQVLTDAKKASLAMAMDAELVAGALVPIQTVASLRYLPHGLIRI